MERRADVAVADRVATSVSDALSPHGVGPRETRAPTPGRGVRAVGREVRLLAGGAPVCVLDAGGIVYRVVFVAWSNRTTAVRRVNASLANATARLEARGAARERTYCVAYNRTVAERVAREDCPRRGPGVWPLRDGSQTGPSVTLRRDDGGGRRLRHAAPVAAHVDRRDRRRPPAPLTGASL